jgi:hypothetical protein
LATWFLLTFYEQETISRKGSVHNQTQVASEKQILKKKLQENKLILGLKNVQGLIPAL